MTPKLPALLLFAGLAAAGCSSPAMPSSSTSAVAATQASVISTVSQATSQASVYAAGPTGAPSPTTTYACPGGGSITSTFTTTLPSGPTGVTTMNSRMEFNACQSGTVTLRGDPYLENSGQYTLVQNADGSMTMSMTSHMTGGTRFDSNGVQGRAQYNCTTVMTVQIVPGSTTQPQPTITWSGSIAWEQPLGSTPAIRSCGG